MSTRLRLLLIAAVVGVAAGAAMGLYIFALRARVTKETQLVTALVAKRDIPAGASAGAVGSQAMSERRQIPFKYLPDGYLASLGPVRGKITNTRIATGEVLTRSRFTDRKTGPAAKLLPKGKLAVGFDITEASGVSSMPKAGSKVAVFATMNPGPEGKDSTKLVLSNVPVVSVTIPEAKAASSAKRTIVLALTPTQAEKGIFAAENGKLWIGLQPEGRKIDLSDQAITVDSLYGK